MGFEDLKEDLLYVVTKLRESDLMFRILLFYLVGSFASGKAILGKSDIDLDVIIDLDVGLGSYMSLCRQAIRQDIKEHIHSVYKMGGLMGSNSIGTDMKVWTKYEFNLGNRVCFYSLDKPYDRIILIDNVFGKKFGDNLNNEEVFLMSLI